MKIIKSKFIINPKIYSIIIIILSINSILFAFAQTKSDEPKLTEAERREADEIATRFTLQFAKTKDVSSLVKLYYLNDFIERKLGEETGNRATEDKWIVPFVSYQTGFLKDTNKKDLQNFYIASHNYFLSMMLFMCGLNKNADIDTAAKKMISPKLKDLFSKNPNLIDLVSFEESEKSIVVSSVKEMQNAVDTLNRGTKIFNDDNKVYVSETKLRKLCKAFQTGGLSKTRVEITDRQYYGVPKGTRIITVVSPLMIALELVKINNKLKIIATLPYAE